MAWLLPVPMPKHQNFCDGTGIDLCDFIKI